MCRIAPVAAVLFCLCCQSISFAEIFHFKDGRIIAGEIVGVPKEIKEEDKAPVTLWTVKLEAGSYIQILETDLVRSRGVEELTPTEKEYAQLIRQTPPRTAEDHVAIAGRYKNKLKEISLAHYQAAVDLDPDNSVARAGAGYKKDSDGRWQKIEAIMGEQRGKIFYKGKWRFPEDVVIEQERETSEQAIAPIRKKLNTWNTAASFGRSEKMRRDAIANLQKVQDPRESAILTEYFLDQRRQPPVNVRLMYVNILSRFPHSIPALTNASLNDPEPRVRTACLDALRKMNAQSSIPTFISYLTNSSNSLVNRAADGIAQFNPREAVLPLIEALNTEHIEDNSGGAGMNVGMQGGLALGGGKKKKKVVRQNASVHGTLTQITGQNFEYDEPRWLAWYASLNAASVRDLRRDP